VRTRKLRRLVAGGAAETPAEDGEWT